MVRKSLCLILAMVLCLSLLPLTALAAEDEALVLDVAGDVLDVDGVAYEAEAPEAYEPEDVDVYVPADDAWLALDGDEDAPISGACGNTLSWVFDAATGTLTVAGIGTMWNFTYNGSTTSISEDTADYDTPWIAHAANIRHVVIGDGVTTIGNYAFATCAALEDVRLPDTLQRIDTLAFFGCASLTAADLPDSLLTVGAYAFARCTSLRSVTLGDGLLNISSNAFNGCTALESIAIPAGVAAINAATFAGCTSLRTVSIADGPNAIGNGAFYGCSALESVNIPATVTAIGDNAFNGCASLASVTVPASVKSIGAYAFVNCTSLADLTLSEGVETIGASCFSSCSGLKSVALPEGLVSVGKSLFFNCSSLESVTLPSTLTTLSDGMFSRCTALADVVIPDTVTDIEKGAFAYCESLKSIAIPEGMTYLNEHIFYNCRGLEEVTLPSTLEVIGQGVFGYCYALKTIEIPEGVTELVYHAFYACISMNTISLPESLRVIGEGAFDNCFLLWFVNYGGSPSEWAAVDVSQTGNDYLLRCFVTYAKEDGAYTLSFWTWADDYSTATATFTGTEDNSLRTVTASIADLSIVAALDAVTEDGAPVAVSHTDEATGNTTNLVTYTATVIGPDGNIYSDAQDVYGLFGGWYKDAAFTDGYTAQPAEGEAAYARLVDPAILTVRFQIPTGTSYADASARLRVVTTVDTLDYAAVGFGISYIRPSTGTAANISAQTSKVYASLNGGGEVFRPSLFSPDSVYFCTYILNAPNALFDTALTVTPNWTTMDGTVVNGTARTYTISQSGSFVNA